MKPGALISHPEDPSRKGVFLPDSWLMTYAPRFSYTKLDGIVTIRDGMHAGFRYSAQTASEIVEFLTRYEFDVTRGYECWRLDEHGGYGFFYHVRRDDSPEAARPEPTP